MQKVIAFPQKTVSQPETRIGSGSKTLFLHIRQSTLIMHLAAARIEVTRGTKVGKV